MTVKELIEKLQTLDQEKEIRIQAGAGYECEDVVEKTFDVKHYEETQKICTDNEGNETHRYYALDNYQDKEKDFYILVGDNVMSTLW